MAVLPAVAPHLTALSLPASFLPLRMPSAHFGSDSFMALVTTGTNKDPAKDKTNMERATTQRVYTTDRS